MFLININTEYELRYYYIFGRYEASTITTKIPLLIWITRHTIMTFPHYETSTNQLQISIYKLNIFIWYDIVPHPVINIFNSVNVTLVNIVRKRMQLIIRNLYKVVFELWHFRLNCNWIATWSIHYCWPKRLITLTYQL